MERKIGMRAFSVLLAVMLVGVGIVPAVAATSEILVETPIPVVAANEQTPSGSLFVISEDVKKATPHWVLFAADEEGKDNAINDLRESSIPDEEKLQFRL